MAGVPELVQRNEMYRWGLNKGRREGVLWTLGIVGAAVVISALVFSLG